jgi:hypothetical protein
LNHLFEERLGELIKRDSQNPPNKISHL